MDDVKCANQRTLNAKFNLTRENEGQMLLLA